MNVETVSVDDLVPDEKNARKGSVGELMKSLGDFGQHRPIVAQRGSNKVIIGNHMLEAAKALGWSQIAVTWVDDDDTTALRRSLADNLTADRSGWDEEQLASLLSELGEEATDLPGLTTKMLDSLLAEAIDKVVEPALLPITARPGEGYSYLVVFTQNDIDTHWLESVMGIRQEQSWKSKKTGRSRVITVSQFKQVLNNAIERAIPYT